MTYKTYQLVKKIFGNGAFWLSKTTTRMIRKRTRVELRHTNRSKESKNSDTSKQENGTPGEELTFLGLKSGVVWCWSLGKLTRIC